MNLKTSIRNDFSQIAHHRRDASEPRGLSRPNRLVFHRNRFFSYPAKTVTYIPSESRGEGCFTWKNATQNQLNDPHHRSCLTPFKTAALPDFRRMKKENLMMQKYYVQSDQSRWVLLAPDLDGAAIRFAHCVLRDCVKNHQRPTSSSRIIDQLSGPCYFFGKLSHQIR